MPPAHGCIATTILYVLFSGAYLGFNDSELRPAPHRERIPSMFLFSNLVRLVRVWRNYDKSLRELSRLGDRELADIGISRSDIQRIAWENART
jgi:uncharacterized protein YjiS (DUF1127 family)